MVGSKDLTPSTQGFGSVFWHNQFRAKPHWPSPTTDLSGKTAIVTGSNTGLGFETVRQLLALKLSHVVLAVRSLERGNHAAKELKQAYSTAQIEVWQLDMSSYISVQSFVERTKSLFRVDFVMLNAGLIKAKFNLVETGHEETLQVNYLSTALLAVLLLPVLKAKGLTGQPPHLSIASAALTLAAKFPNKDARPLLPSFGIAKTFDPSEHYNSSKLLMQMFLWKLIDYVSADDVVVSLPDPAWVKGTNLGRDFPAGVRMAMQIFALTGRTKQVGASCFVDSLVNKGKEAHGCFIMSWELHPWVY